MSAADSSDMDHSNESSYQPMYPPSYATTGPPNSSSRVRNPPRQTIYSVSGVVGYTKDHEQFPTDWEANPGTIILCTDHFDETCDDKANLVVVFRPPPGVPSLGCSSIFVPEESVSEEAVEVVNDAVSEPDQTEYVSVTTYKTPAAGIASITILPDDEQPFADNNQKDPLLPAEVEMKCEEWSPVQIQICIEDSPRSSYVQDTTGSQDSRVFWGDFLDVCYLNMVPNHISLIFVFILESCKYVHR